MAKDPTIIVGLRELSLSALSHSLKKNQNIVVMVGQKCESIE